MDLLKEIAAYLATKTSKTLGQNVFYYEMPEEPAECILVQEESTPLAVPAQIDAQHHRIMVTIRGSSNIYAKELADLCWRWLLCDDLMYDVDRSSVNVTGFIQLNNGIYVYVQLYSSPVWLKVDQKGRKYFSFKANVVTTK